MSIIVNVPLFSIAQLPSGKIIEFPYKSIVISCPSFIITGSEITLSVSILISEGVVPAESIAVCN